MATETTATPITSGWSDQEIIRRYERLSAGHTNRDACFVCEKVRPTVNALVRGPWPYMGIENPTGTVGRGHGVCRPCIKSGEAVALR